PLGSNMDPDWSPDGRSLAYVSRRRLTGPRAEALVIRSLDSGAERDLWPELAWVARPRWSPDGRSFLVGGQNRQGVSAPWLVNARTGAILSRLPRPGVEWASDGRAVFDIDGGQKKVQRTDVSSGRAREVYQDPAGGHIAGIAVSPDGHSLAIAVDERDVHPGVRRLEVVSTSGGPSREIMRFTEPDLFMLQQWTRDGASILFTRARDEK